ncbi:MAG: hypothetical protein U0325_34640 [Polyangiales bacterium]
MSTAVDTLLRLEPAGFGPKNAFAFEVLGHGRRGRVGARLGETLAGPCRSALGARD